MKPETKKAIVREALLVAVIPLYWVYLIARSAARAARKLSNTAKGREGMRMWRMIIGSIFVMAALTMYALLYTKSMHAVIHRFGSWKGYFIYVPAYIVLGVVGGYLLLSKKK